MPHQLAGAYPVQAKDRTRERAGPLKSRPGRLPGYTIGISAGQTYRTSSPVTARPMIIRWISLVPSKIVKIFAGKAESSVSPVTILTCGNVDSRGFR
jgi:hypothetical protein